MTQLESSDDQHTAIDRLVACDLNETEREELVRWFEQQPIRWRECGLAFLEAQLWRQAFQPVVERTRSEVAKPVLGHTMPIPANNKVRQTGAPRIVTTMVALLVAFGCGLAAGRAPLDIIAPAPSLETADGPKAPATRTERTAPSIADRSDTQAVGATEANPPPASPQQAPLTSPDQHGNKVAEVAIPVISSAAAPAATPGRPTTGVPEYIERQWQRRGYQVKQTQRWLPLALNDGRRVVVPVDQWQLKYVGRPAY